MTTTERLNALVTGPKSWVVVSTYANGAERECAQPLEVSAFRFAERERAKISAGKPDMLTNSCVVAVRVEHRPC